MLKLLAVVEMCFLFRSTEQSEFDVLNYTVNVPCGVVGLITPWNLPLYLLSFKLAPAIASGCCVIAKPSEMTSVTAWMLCKVLCEAGLKYILYKINLKLFKH